MNKKKIKAKFDIRDYMDYECEDEHYYNYGIIEKLILERISKYVRNTRHIKIDELVNDYSDLYRTFYRITTEITLLINVIDNLISYMIDELDEIDDEKIRKEIEMKFADILRDISIDAYNIVLDIGTDYYHKTLDALIKDGDKND